jgi:hypothetical protein
MAEKRYSADRYPLRIHAGADFSKTWIYYPDGVDALPKDWTGYTAAAQIRTSARAADPLLDFTVVLADDGSVTLSAPAADTGDLHAATAVWDLKVTGPSGSVDVLIGGTVLIAPAVTR